MLLAYMYGDSSLSHKFSRLQSSEKMRDYLFGIRLFPNWGFLIFFKFFRRTRLLFCCRFLCLTSFTWSGVGWLLGLNNVFIFSFFALFVICCHFLLLYIDGIKTL